MHKWVYALVGLLVFLGFPLMALANTLLPGTPAPSYIYTVDLKRESC